MPEIQDWLPKIKANPRAWLPAIIRSGETELALELIRDHPDLFPVRFSGNATLLHVAAYSEQPAIVAALLAAGARMDFIAAIVLRRMDLVQAMLDADPSLVHRRSPDRWTGLHIAVGYSNAEIVALLIAAGAEVNRPGNRGRTPLFFVGAEPFDNARLLLDHGADINAAAKHGFTALHSAAIAGNADFVRFLVAHGANTNAQTDARQTAWALAVRWGHRNVAAILAGL